MKKKIAMRVASLALCVVFTASVFGAPKAKAVAAETAIGVAVVAAYFAATGLVLSASAGSTGELVTTGVGKIVTDFCAAVDHAGQTATDFYATLVSNTNIRPDGALALSAAAVVAIGELVAWYIGENGLEEEGSTAVAVPGTSDIYSYNGVVLPDIDSVWIDKQSLPYAYIVRDGSYYRLHLLSVPVTVNDASRFDFFLSGGTLCAEYTVSYSNPLDNGWALAYSGALKWGTSYSYTMGIWSSVDVFTSQGNLALAMSDPLLAGDISNQLEVTRSPEFVQLDSDFAPESQKQMVIDLGFGAGTTLDTVAEEVLNLIAAGELSPTYEIQSTAPEVDDDLPYIPILSEILQGVQSIAGAVVDGILNGLEGLFVPSEAYMEALPAQITDTFDERTGFLTYPFSLLPDFVDRLSAPSDDWVLRWPQIAEPFTGTILFQQGSWNVTAFVQANAQIHRIYDLWRLIAKALMSFGFIGLCYNKYRSVVGDRYGEG